MKISKDKTNLIIKIPLYQDSLDYFGKKVGTISNLIGVVCHDNDGNEELGFHQLIDMTYKDKDSQIDGLLVSYQGDKEEFERICLELGISYFEYPQWDHCKKDIYGSFSSDKEGKNICFDCDLLLKKNQV